MTTLSVLTPPGHVTRFGRLASDTATLIPILISLAATPSASAQASCSSDGQRTPTMLTERFISADCPGCWSAAATPRAPRGTLALDWVVPGALGDDAPLSGAATRDASTRLEALGRDAPRATSTLATRVGPVGSLRLRVAHGPAVNGYVGVSIRLRRPDGLEAPFTAWLALVETLPPGTEGSPVARNLVRNVLNPLWNGHDLLSKKMLHEWDDFRVMSIPEGANPKRLRVIGWVQDAAGRIRVAAQSRC